LSELVHLVEQTGIFGPEARIVVVVVAAVVPYRNAVVDHVIVAMAD
jgi:hypothetical protein